MGQRDAALRPAGQPGGVFQCGTWDATPLPQSEGPLDLRPCSSWGETPKPEGMGQVSLGRAMPTPRRRAVELKEKHTT